MALQTYGNNISNKDEMPKEHKGLGAANSGSTCDHVLL